MALVVGTNCGFVTTAPTSNPGAGNNIDFDDRAIAFENTSPSGNNIIIEIGWYTATATEESNFEVGIYDHNVGDDEPEAVVGSLSQTNAKGTGTGWKVATGLNIPINAETIYWIAAQLDNTTTTTTMEYTTTGTQGRAIKTSQTTLTDPWGTTGTANRRVAIYALVEAAPVGVTRKIKIAGTFQDKPIKEKKAGTFQDKPISIKVGGTFQDA